MKNKELVKRLKKTGFVFVRHGGNHDIYQRGKDHEQIPRHAEINEFLARSIIKKWNL
ncbi:MAG: type II toxin-antitoxin system HicA family toxin [Treponema sp.]|nr:type II toxin-antitoxin system HicA family toxin [Treponema sp.]